MRRTKAKSEGGTQTHKEKNIFPVSFVHPKKTEGPRMENHGLSREGGEAAVGVTFLFLPFSMEKVP